MIRKVTKRLAKRRPGTVYVTVLIVALAVALMAASAARVAKVHLRGLSNTHQRHAARLLAISAIDHALVKFNNEPTWETDYSLDTEYPATPVAANGGSFTWKLFDLGGGLKRLDGIGRVADAECVLSVNLGNSLASDALSVPLLCGGDLWIGNYTFDETLTVTGGPACTNGDLKNWNQVTGDVEAQSESVVGTVTGTKTIPGALRSLPDPLTVFDYYMAQGTDITAAVVANFGNVDTCVLSPNTNTLGGGVDPDGIYIIDNPGVDISFRDCRIVGTLIVRVPGGSVEIKKELNWEPARSNWPALMIEGNLNIILEDADVDESSLFVNLNPSGTPWQGSTDTDTSDSYPSEIGGIVYVTGNVLVDGKSSDNSPGLRGGVLICGGWCRITKSAHLELTYDNAAFLDPPPGFGSGDSSSIVSGSWRQTPSP